MLVLTLSGILSYAQKLEVTADPGDFALASLCAVATVVVIYDLAAKSEPSYRTLVPILMAVVVPSIRACLDPAPTQKWSAPPMMVAGALMDRSGGLLLLHLREKLSRRLIARRQALAFNADRDGVLLDLAAAETTDQVEDNTVAPDIEQLDSSSWTIGSASQPKAESTSND